MDVTFYYPFLYQNGNLRRFDSANMCKPLFDLIAKKGGFDDSRIKASCMNSVDVEAEYVEVVIMELEELNGLD